MNQIKLGAALAVGALLGWSAARFSSPPAAVHETGHRLDRETIGRLNLELERADMGLHYAQEVIQAAREFSAVLKQDPGRLRLQKTSFEQSYRLEALSRTYGDVVSNVRFSLPVKGSRLNFTDSTR